MKHIIFLITLGLLSASSLAEKRHDRHCISRIERCCWKFKKCGLVTVRKPFFKACPRKVCTVHCRPVCQTKNVPGKPRRVCKTQRAGDENKKHDDDDDGDDGRSIDDDDYERSHEDDDYDDDKGVDDDRDDEKDDDDDDDDKDHDYDDDDDDSHSNKGSDVNCRMVRRNKKVKECRDVCTRNCHKLNRMCRYFNIFRVARFCPSFHCRKPVISGKPQQPKPHLAKKGKFVKVEFGKLMEDGKKHK